MMNQQMQYSSNSQKYHVQVYKYHMYGVKWSSVETKLLQMQHIQVDTNAQLQFNKTSVSVTQHHNIRDTEQQFK